MKKVLFAILLSFGLILFMTGCSSDTTTTEGNTEDTSISVEKPVSDVTGGTGIEGTWEATDVENDIQEDTVLALNSDGTYELYEASNSSSAVNVDSIIAGTYEYTDTMLTLTPDEGEGEKTEYSYVLDGDKLTLTTDDKTLELERD